MDKSDKYEPVIGLEVHVQLLTKSKIFCNCSTKFGSEPNSNTCPICLGLPGVLPVLNKKAIKYTIKLGLATNCKISPESIFARKNYFYPDLPKGYQISQYENPFCYDGWVKLNSDNSTRQIRIKRIHLEEDAGKSVHDEVFVDNATSLIDLNRCGVPLVELVTEPDLKGPDEASKFMMYMRQLVQYLNICDGNMEEGSLRCDANVSVKPIGEKKLGVKTELKNMNSFRNVERAIEFEIQRQISILDQGKMVEQATLLWDADKNKAHVMRIKEEEHDYRYFPEPDLVPVFVDKKELENIQQTLPELPQEKKARFIREYKLPEYDAEILTSSSSLANYFESVLINFPEAKLASNWIMGEVLRVLNEEKIEIHKFPVSAKKLGQLLALIQAKTISASAAKKVFDEMLTSSDMPEEIIERLGLKQVSDQTTIQQLVDKIIAENPTEVIDYRSGKQKVFGFLVGQVMKESKGKANPQLVTQILKEKL